MAWKEALLAKPISVGNVPSIGNIGILEEGTFGGCMIVGCVMVETPPTFHHHVSPSGVFG